MKNEKINKLLLDIEKAYGKGSVLSLSGNKNIVIDTIPTGSVGLNNAIGVGGYPRGRITEIYGPESSGKTTLALHAIAEAQQKKLQAAFIDVEHALDVKYAKSIGVKTEELIISQPDSGEQALGILETLVKSEMVDIIILDSVAALVPEIELSGQMFEQTIGAQARLMSKALRKITAWVSKNNCAVIFINQLRAKVGISWGSSETTSGGRALRFYSSLRLDIRKIETVKNPNGVAYCNKVKVKVVKNKMASPFKIANFEINYNEGIDKLSEIINTATKMEVVNKKGIWYYYNDQKLGQGILKTKKFLKENPDILKTIETKIK